MIRSILLGSALAVVPVAAHAVSWNVASDFNAPVFSYGSGTNGGAFTALPLYNANLCFGIANLACYQSAPNDHPVIALKTVSAYSSGGVEIPLDTVYLHPANATPDTDALLRFTAPTTSTYRLTGRFQHQDSTGNGNGTFVSIFASTGPTALFTAALPATSWGSSTSFGSIDVLLAAGQSVTFGVNNNGGPLPSYVYDSTGLAATITAVPEPTAWALMIGGFGVVGGAMRMRRRAVFA